MSRRWLPPIGSNLLDAPMIDWRDRPADLVGDDLAYVFYALLDDAGLREVFGDFMVPAAKPPPRESFTRQRRRQRLE